MPPRAPPIALHALVCIFLDFKFAGELQSELHRSFLPARFSLLDLESGSSKYTGKPYKTNFAAPFSQFASPCLALGILTVSIRFVWLHRRTPEPEEGRSSGQSSYVAQPVQYVHTLAAFLTFSWNLCFQSINRQTQTVT